MNMREYIYIYTYTHKTRQGRKSYHDTIISPPNQYNTRVFMTK